MLCAHGERDAPGHCCGQFQQGHREISTQGPQYRDSSSPETERVYRPARPQLPRIRVTRAGWSEKSEPPSNLPCSRIHLALHPRRIRESLLIGMGKLARDRFGMAIDKRNVPLGIWIGERRWYAPRRSITLLCMRWIMHRGEQIQKIERRAGLHDGTIPVINRGSGLLVKPDAVAGALDLRLSFCNFRRRLRIAVARHIPVQHIAQGILRRMDMGGNVV